MQILLSYLKNYKGTAALALLLAAINQTFSLLDPMIAGIMLDRFGVHVSDYQNDPTKDFIGDLVLLLLASMGVAMVSRIAKNFQDYFTSVVVQKTGARMYTDGIRHSLELPYEVFEDQRSGETLGKLQKVRSDSERFIQAFISVVFQTGVGLIFVIWYSFSINWIIAPVFLLTVPVLGLVSNLLSRNIKKVSKQILGETTSLAGSTTESLRNIELVKSLGLADQEVGRLNATTVKILGLELKKVRFIRSLSFVQGTTVNFLRTCFLFLLYYLVFHDQITPGKLMTLMFYSFFIFGPLQELGNVIAIYRETQVSLQKFQEILSTPAERKARNPSVTGAIQELEFESVSFKHQSSRQYAVDDISFKVRKGETVAFVGPSGAGKTTLVKLLVGLYDPHMGRILYNNISNLDIDRNELRQQIGFVTQDTQLFSGSIRENLIFVNPKATDEECMEVLRQASCQSLLDRADKGLDTVIGEGGVKVSGGEKQRLSIARALLRNPNILVFDEATSALDSITEEEITATIRSLSGKKEHLTFMIAHRLSTIMHADRIYVLEKGKITESGSHSRLLEQKGLYYAMWRQQIGERKLSDHENGSMGQFKEKAISS
ncbi:MAG: ABC transporter ATP-binding protein [Bacteroidetes bacterium]|nr:MAG: ABC transporter ATP-binding protein [Bacteroidota bacterium]REK06600.1 MAG: ABC transporter ATP-binding protein [Bacteroidota bacterium]REK33366.1 MAG: ABC transporter ATP-binding protein [Bacteroidota bacterium]REK49765.1 MAG: ABC transporter ATP-binding protein [Bacteroidota bacterium]